MAPRKLRVQRLVLLGLLLLGAIIIGSMVTAVMGREREAAQALELRSVQQAVSLMMADNGITVIPSPVGQPTNDMSRFPDATTPPRAKGLLEGDKPGYVLRGHDTIADMREEPTVDYITKPYTKWTYTVSRAGLVQQEEESPQ